MGETHQPPAQLVASDPPSNRARQLHQALGATLIAEDAANGTLVVWTEPWARTVPLPAAGQAVHVLDLHGAIAACPGWGAAAQAAWGAQVAASCRGAALLLVGSDAELGFWSALLAGAGVTSPIAVVPYAGPIASSAEPGRAVLVSGSAMINPALRPALDDVGAWARTRGLGLQISPGADPADWLAAGTLLPPPPPGRPSLLLDLREDTVAERAATPPAVIDALAAGIPVLSTVDGALSQAIAAAGAGQVIAGRLAIAAATLDAGPVALALARASFGPAAAAQALHRAIGRATARTTEAKAIWRRSGPRPPQPLGPAGHVLVLSEESQTLGAVRIHAPFGALHRRGAIGGYAVMRQGKIVFDTRPQGETGPFDALWVHRSMDPAHLLLIELLGRPFAYDIDDNLLASPSYRDTFDPIARRTTQDLLHAATAVSCATPRLGRLLAARLPTRMADRLVITPNLAQDRPALREAGPPRALVWASSDRPALTASKAAIIRAVRDHCLAHRTKLVCIGAPPPETIAGSGVTIEAVGLLPHAGYREYLRNLSPSILVCPLETRADAETQAFIDGKSDIKIIEALAEGLVCVASRATPYEDSDLPAPILCDNTYVAWLAGLEAARAACLAPAPRATWPEGRDSAAFGLAPWAEALARVRLPAPLCFAELTAALDRVDAQRSPLLQREMFDEDDYLANYADVRDAVETGAVPSGYDHYANAGRAERRFARSRSSPGTDSETWWATLLHEVTMIEATAAHRDAQIGALERRMALRQTLAARIP